MQTHNWISEFRQYLIDQDRGENTVKAYCRDLNLYARWFEEMNSQAFEPSLLNAPDLREYRRHLLDDEKMKGSTWNRRRASFKAFSMWAIFNGHIHTDPMHGVNAVKGDRRVPLALSETEYRALRREMDHMVNSAKTPKKKIQAIRDRAALAFGLYAGVRSGEVVKLEVSDLLLRVKSGEMQIRQGKGRTDAELDIPDELRHALKPWMDIHPGTSKVFPISQREIERRAKAIGKAAGIDRMWFHRTRHTMISRALNVLEIPLPIVQAAARHVRGETTMMYATATRTQVLDALNRL
jgi:site-specific recombinase XerD